MPVSRSSSYWCMLMLSWNVNIIYHCNWAESQLQHFVRLNYHWTTHVDELTKLDISYFAGWETLVVTATNYWSFTQKDFFHARSNLNLQLFQHCFCCVLSALTFQHIWTVFNFFNCYTEACRLCIISLCLAWQVCCYWNCFRSFCFHLAYCSTKDSAFSTVIQLPQHHQHCFHFP